MTSQTSAWELIGVLTFAAVFLTYLIRWMLTGRSMFTEGELIGELGRCEIRIIWDEDDGRMIGLILDKTDENPIYAGITLAQARDLANWLRIAATRGKTLGEAKRNFRQKQLNEAARAQGASAPP